MSIHELEGFSTNMHNEGALYLPFLNIACSHVAAIYSKWFRNLEKQERVTREVEKLAVLLEPPKNVSGNAAVMKRSGWILSSISTKERLKRVSNSKQIADVLTLGKKSFS